jgi:hypothetical protein
MYKRGQWPDLATADSEAGKPVLDELIRTVRGQPGNQSFTGGVDLAGRASAISIQDTEEHARELLTVAMSKWLWIENSAASLASAEPMPRPRSDPGYVR